MKTLASRVSTSNLLKTDKGPLQINLSNLCSAELKAKAQGKITLECTSGYDLKSCIAFAHLQFMIIMYAKFHLNNLKFEEVVCSNKPTNRVNYAYVDFDLHFQTILMNEESMSYIQSI